jgi:hypothetical protein
MLRPRNCFQWLESEALQAYWDEAVALYKEVHKYIIWQGTDYIMTVTMKSLQ